MKNNMALLSTFSCKGITRRVTWETNRTAVARADRDLVRNVALSLNSHVISDKSPNLHTAKISHWHR